MLLFPFYGGGFWDPKPAVILLKHAYKKVNNQENRWEVFFSNLLYPIFALIY